MAQSSFDQTDLNHIFLRAFQDCATGIINSLSTDADDPATATAIQTIVAQCNHDYNRFSYVVDTIQARVYRDSGWVSVAVAVYDLVATFIDPAFTHPVSQIRGPLLVQHQLMKALQDQFTGMMAKDIWSPGFTLFLGQLCRAKDSIGQLTPGIVLHIINEMVQSSSLFQGRNLDLLFEFVIAVGPFLDDQALRVVDGFGENLQGLQKRVDGSGLVTCMAVFGLLKLRECGWKVEGVDVT